MMLDFLGLPNQMHDIIRPFGPRIYYTKVPEIIINQLNDGFDSMSEKEDHSHRLVGHVAEETTLNIEMFPMFGAYMSKQLNTFFSEYNNEWHTTRGLEPKPYAEQVMCVTTSWFVRSFDCDYNPSHIHDGCDYSCILYTKIPPTISDKNTRNPEKTTTEGYIDFLYGGDGFMCHSSLTRQPKVGDLYIFPSHLRHTAYPFYGEGERRSISMNMILRPKGDNNE